MAYPFVVLSLFPDMISQAVSHSIIGRGVCGDLLSVSAINIRDFAQDRHKTTDDVPYGGGAGMVMKPEPIVGAIGQARQLAPDGKVVLMSASGRPFKQAVAQEYANSPGGLILICGHYEGVDERIADHYVDDEISIGDYVLSGGELAALVVLDATARLIPGVLGNAQSLDQESHEGGLLEYPHYTRPPKFEGHEVPAVLLSGNHREIERFRQERVDPSFVTSPLRCKKFLHQAAIARSCG